MKVQLIVRLYANCIIVCLKYAVVCSKYAIDFLLVLMIDHYARLKVYLLSLIVQRCNCFSVDAIEC